MIFARKADDALASLVKQIDKAVADNSDKQIAAILNFMGPDKEALKETAQNFAKGHNITQVAMVVPSDHENGPKGYKIHSDAEVTVILYSYLKVVANHAVRAGQLDKRAIKAIVDDTVKMLD